MKSGYLVPVVAAAFCAGLGAAEFLRGETALETWTASPSGAHPGMLRVEGQEIKLDLRDLAAGTTIHAARLRALRDPVDGTMDEAIQPVEIFADPGGAGKPLELLPPWYDSFEATAAIRAALANPSAPQSFLVKSFPKWQKDKTALEIAFEGKSKNLPPQVKGVKAFHRAGQTFITWQESDKRVQNENVGWGELRQLIAEMDKTSRVRYRIYRHSAPITAASIARAEFLAEVPSFSGYNVRGRSVDQLLTSIRRRAIDDLDLAKKLAREGYFGRYNPEMPEMAEVAINRLAIEDGKPLPLGTGLYVHAPGQTGRAYYAVAASVDGVANLAEWTAENSAQNPIAEVTGTGEPVFQGQPDVVVFFDYPGARRHYVQWAAPPLANLPNQYYNWGIYIPQGYAEGKIKRLSIFFHDSLQRFLKPAWPHRQDTVLLSPHDAPYRSYGYGYHASLGTLRSFKDGQVEPFFGRRVDAFLAWAMKLYNADPGRVSCGGHGNWGGTAALEYGLRRAGTIAYVMADKSADPDPDRTPYDYSPYGRGDKSKTHRAEMDAVWGKSDWNMPAEGGKPIWEETGLPAYVRANGKKTVLPYFSLGAGSMHVTWPQETEIMKAYLETRNAFMAEFWWGSTPFLPLPVSADMGDRPFEPRNDRPLIAVASKDYGPEPKFMGEHFEPAKRGYGAGGRLNTKHRWDPEDIVETADRLEMTIFSGNVVYAGKDTCEVTVRNTRAFKPAAGEKVAWSLQDAKQNKTKSAEAAVTAEGFIILTDVPFGAPARLILERAAK